MSSSWLSQVTPDEAHSSSPRPQLSGSSPALPFPTAGRTDISHLKGASAASPRTHSMNRQYGRGDCAVAQLRDPCSTPPWSWLKMWLTSRYVCGARTLFPRLKPVPHDLCSKTHVSLIQRSSHACEYTVTVHARRCFLRCAPSMICVQQHEAEQVSISLFACAPE